VISTNLRILIIDDNKEDRETCMRFLSRDKQVKYEFMEAESAAEGIAELDKNKPDCILLDYILVDMDGLEFLKVYRDKLINTAAAVIFMTGQGNESIAVQAMKNGAMDYIVKDKFNSELLIKTIRDVIEKKYDEISRHEHDVLIQKLYADSIENIREIIRVAGKEKKRLLKLIQKYDTAIQKFPRGTIQKKIIAGKKYGYLLYREENKVKTEYIGPYDSGKILELSKKIDRRKKNEEMRKQAVVNLKAVEKILKNKKLI
jgi:CheY-like chemotaxis protein